MGLRRRTCALSAALVLSLRVASARATTDDIPSQCGSRAELERELRQRLGESTPLTEVHVSITPGARGYHLRAQIGSELRELDDPSCSELFRASMVIAIAVLMHAREVAEQKPPVEAPLPPEPAATHPRFTLTGGVGASVGTLPKPVLALELEAATLWRTWGLALDVRYLFAADKLQADRGATLSAWSAGVAGVLRPSRAWQARLGFAAQNLRGTGVRNAANQSASVWAAGPTLGLGWYPWQEGSLWGGIGAEGQLNAVRGRFQIRNFSGELSDKPYDIYSVPLLAGAGFLRLGASW